MILFNDTELFNSGEPRIQRFDIPDAELTLYEHFFNREESDRFYKILLEETPWKQEPITIHRQTHMMPRLIAWYGSRRSGKPPTPFTPTIEVIKEKVEAASKVEFTSVLLNLYRNGKDSVAWHRDHDREFGKDPVIGSVSFGETRPFQIRHKFRKDLDKMEIPLNHGSFLLRGGAMQHYWEHRIPRTTREVRSRINLTFRVVRDWR